MCYESTIQSDLSASSSTNTCTLQLDTSFFVVVLNVHCIHSFYWFNFVNPIQAIPRIQCIVKLTFYFTYSGMPGAILQVMFRFRYFLCAICKIKHFYFGVRREHKSAGGVWSGVWKEENRAQETFLVMILLRMILFTDSGLFTHVPCTHRSVVCNRNVLEIELKTLYWWEIVKEY